MEFEKGHHTWFNLAQDVAVPMDMNSGINQLGTSNLIKLGHKAFMPGWNCCQVTLPYSQMESDSQTLALMSRLMNTSDLDLFGEGYAYSEGTILTYGSANPISGLNNEISSVVGNSAKEYIEDMIEGNEDSSRGLVGGLIGTLVNKGLNKVFNMITASFSKATTTESDIEFATHLDLDITGDLTFQSSSPLKSLRIYADKNSVGELGNWNLAYQPIVYLNPLADYVKDFNGREFEYLLRGVTRYQYEIVLNPELEAHVKKQWTGVSLIKYWDINNCGIEIPECYENFGTLGGNNFRYSTSSKNNENSPVPYFMGGIYGKPIYGEDRTANAIYEEPLNTYTLTTDENFYNQYQQGLNVVFAPNTSCHASQVFMGRNTFMKLSLYLVTEFEWKTDTTLYTRTYMPKLEWYPDYYDSYINNVSSI